jgi:hypothetical protein
MRQVPRIAPGLRGNIKYAFLTRGGEEEAYERAERQATTLFDQGFHWGGVIRIGRDDLPER